MKDSDALRFLTNEVIALQIGFKFLVEDLHILSSFITAMDL
jgi:hypothetical protein